MLKKYYKLKNVKKKRGTGCPDVDLVPADFGITSKNFRTGPTGIWIGSTKLERIPGLAQTCIYAFGNTHQANLYCISEVWDEGTLRLLMRPLRWPSIKMVHQSLGGGGGRARGQRQGFLGRTLHHQH